jgi:hypothetical protein
MRYNNKCWTTIIHHEGHAQERNFSRVTRSSSFSCAGDEKRMIDRKGCLLCLPLCLESTSHRDQTRVIRKNGTKQEKPRKTHPRDFGSSHSSNHSLLRHNDVESYNLIMVYESLSRNYTSSLSVKLAP